MSETLPNEWFLLVKTQISKLQRWISEFFFLQIVFLLSEEIYSKFDLIGKFFESNVIWRKSISNVRSFAES